MMLRRLVAGERFGVHLGHDQRHVGVHPVERAVVDHRAAGGRGARGVGLADRRAGGEQGDVPAGEVEIVEVLDLELLAIVAEVDDVALAAAGGERRHLVERKLPLGQDLQHLAPDIARRADDGDPITHASILRKSLSRAYRERAAPSETYLAGATPLRSRKRSMVP